MEEIIRKLRKEIGFASCMTNAVISFVGAVLSADVLRGGVLSGLGIAFVAVAILIDVKT